MGAKKLTGARNYFQLFFARVWCFWAAKGRGYWGLVGFEKNKLKSMSEFSVSQSREILDGMNVNYSSWVAERDLQQPAVARGELWRGALQKGAACQQSGGAWVAEVLAHGHHGEREWQAVARRTGLVLWAPKARCHLSPPSPPAKRAGGCLRTATGEGLSRLVKITRLDGAWTLGCTGAMDLVDHMDGVDRVGQKDEGFCLAMGTKKHAKARIGTKRHEILGVFFSCHTIWGSPPSRPIWLKKGRAQADESRLVPLNPAKNLVCEKFIFLSDAGAGVLAGGVLADCHHAQGYDGGIGRTGEDRETRFASSFRRRSQRAMADRRLVALESGLDGLASQALQVSCPQEPFASRKAISLPIVGWLAHGPWTRPVLLRSGSLGAGGRKHGPRAGGARAILLPPRREREARAILRLPPLGVGFFFIRLFWLWSAWCLRTGPAAQNPELRGTGIMGEDGQLGDGFCIGSHRLFLVCFFVFTLGHCGKSDGSVGSGVYTRPPGTGFSGMAERWGRAYCLDGSDLVPGGGGGLIML
ncbi:MAG: hypothetical protein JWR26_2074 [Pedosphaera sp.]|nr:hypothetical protein [Pedosphaera sp.]